MEKCALMREKFMVLPTFFWLTSTRSRCTATDPPWRLSVSFEDTVSGKEAGNRGFEKH